VSTTPYVYVIMPVQSDPHYKEKRAVLSSAAVHAGIDVHFPLDHLSAHGADFDLEETLSALSHSIGVVADLSLERPSCYYELGLAQALKVPVVLVAQAGTVIHQADYRGSVVEYSDSKSYGDVLEEAFDRLIADRQGGEQADHHGALSQR